MNAAPSPTYAELSAPLYPAAPRERVLVGLLKQDLEHKREDEEYETRRSYVLARIQRQIAAGGRALRAAGVDPRAPGFDPVVYLPPPAASIPSGPTNSANAPSAASSRVTPSA